MVKAWKPILAALVIFGAGVMTGRLTTKLREPANSNPIFPVEGLPAHPAPGQRMDRQLDFLMRRVQRDLDLTDKQAGHVKKAFEGSRERMRSFWEEMKPRMRQETKAMREQLQTYLTEEQLEKFNKYLRRHDPNNPRNRWERRGSRGSRPNGPAETNGRRPRNPLEDAVKTNLPPEKEPNLSPRTPSDQSVPKQE